MALCQNKREYQLGRREAAGLNNLCALFFFPTVFTSAVFIRIYYEKVMNFPPCIQFIEGIRTEHSRCVIELQVLYWESSEAMNPVRFGSMIIS